MDKVSYIESMNQGVRGILTLGLGTLFCYGFFVGKISGEVFTAVFTGIVGFWFGQRRDAVPPVITTTSPDGTTTVAAGGTKP